VKILLDTCVWGGACKVLRDAGHDVVWAGEWPEDPGDDEILARAQREGRILVTLDKDFGELVFLEGKTHCGIIRLVDLSAKEQARVCSLVLLQHGKELTLGAIVTAEPGRLRIRLPEGYSIKI
jgi:predicted nuclease of predicted toxin-antitoxin system